MIVLGLESSCDETAVGIVEIDENQDCTLLANEVATSLDLHKLYGGVVPEIAARSHIESVIGVVDEALRHAFGEVDLGRAAGDEPSKIQDPRSKILSDPWSKIDAIAVTYGGGLGGSLLVGVMTARTLAIVKNKPLYAVNHVIGHVYANFLTELKSETRDRSQEPGGAAGRSSEQRAGSKGQGAMSTEGGTGDEPSKLQDPSSKIQSLQGRDYTLPSTAPQFPMLALIVSGKHSQLALFRDHFDYDLLGWTRDDAVGEAFDKVAKLLGLPYPGGPSVAEAAKKGDAHAYTFPKPHVVVENDSLNALRLSMETRSYEQKKLPNYDFSFSGIKTAVLRTAQAEIGEDFTFPSFKIAERLNDQQKWDIAASFQRTAIEILVDKTVEACQEFSPRSLVLAGGVAASAVLRRQLGERLLDLGSESLDLGEVVDKSKEQGARSMEGAVDAANPSFKLQAPRSILQYPDIKLCTDNGAMIATLGCFMARLGQPTADPYSLEIAPNLTM